MAADRTAELVSHNADGDSPPDNSIVVDVKQIQRGIAMAVGALVLGAIWTLTALYTLGLGDTIVGKISVRLLDLDEERGIPAAFSLLFLLATAGAVWLSTWAATAEPSITRYPWRWRLLSLVLVGIGFDEAFVLHEELSGYLRATFDATGPLYHAWVVLYGAGALVIAAFMIPPLAALPRRARTLMLAGGACYVLGAAGMEMIGAQFRENNAAMYLRETEILVEELMELGGVWLFFSGVLTLLRQAILRFDVR
jgi:hypothetical protein